ncbi:MAG: serine/threonine-protein kinase [Pirellulales bacterium]
MSTTARSEESIFAEALDQPSAEARAAFLGAACEGDAGLRARLEKLLKSHTGAGSFLRKPLVGTAEQPPTDRPGTVIGPYKLLQQIGEGGMGVVYMAEQEQPVRRRVALKIIKPGMDSRQVIARFEAERQALAMMDHQHIAKVLDAGTTQSARPYFVMELVHGVPLTKFCDDNRLTLRQRLELFVPVCHAIQHAHQKGIIHRDIKPTNILVTMYDDEPVPKVIDFGVAKALEQRLTEKTLFTQFGTLVGTFEYMSPEQAEMNAFGVDTRSDVYSLGVLLYELLTGTTPIERQRLSEAALGELVRLIKEEEAPRPSVRLSTSAALPKVAAACKTEPERLSQLLRGELDWIVMKCLEKDRTRRYETVNGLARDVQRYLADEPVEACPPSITYRLRKIARKHRRLLTAAASFAALLLIATLVSISLAAWAIDAQRRAEQALASERVARAEAIAAKDKAESFSKRLSAATQISNEGLNHYHKANWALAHDRFAKAEEIEPGLNQIYTFRSMLYANLGLWDRALADYDRRFRLARQGNAQWCYEHALLKRILGDEPGYHRACQEALRQHSQANLAINQFYVVRTCLLSPEPVHDPIVTAEWAERLAADNYLPWFVSAAAVAHLRRGNFEKAAARSREAITMGGNSEAGIYRRNYLTLAMALHRLGRQSEAEDALARGEQAIDEWTRAMQEGSVGTMPINWWDWLECLVFHREAKILVTGSHPPDDPRLSAIRERALAAITYGDAFTFMEAAREHFKRKDWEQAAASFSKVLDQLPLTFRGYSGEMRMCVEMVQQPEVFASLIKLRPDDPRLWYARGRTYASQSKWSQASADYAKALRLRMDEWSRAGRSKASGDWSRTGRQIGSLTHDLAALRVLAGDEAAYADLRAIVMRYQDQVNDQVAAHLFSRACTLIPSSVTDWSVPVRLAELAVAKEPTVAWHLYTLAAAQYRAGDYAQAAKRAEESLKVHPTWIGRGQNFAVLALVCQRLGRHDDARKWLAETKAWLHETNRAMARTEFGYAASNYLGDWLSAQILLQEAETLIRAQEVP